MSIPSESGKTGPLSSTGKGGPTNRGGRKNPGGRRRTSCAVSLQKCADRSTHLPDTPSRLQCQPLLHRNCCVSNPVGPQGGWAQSLIIVRRHTMPYPFSRITHHSTTPS